MQVDLVRSPHPPILEVELEPPANIRERGGLEYEADLNVLFTKRNRVAVYDVFVQQLTEAIDQEILDRLELKWSATPLLSVVSVDLGCMPHHDCKFTWLRVSCDLGHEIIERRLRPLACKLYPEGSEDSINVVKSFEVSSKLGIKVLEVTTPELSSKDSSQKQYESYHYRLTTVGRMSPSPAWNFRTTDVHPEIVGDFTLMLVVAMKPGIEATGEISISAQAQLRSGLVSIPLITKRTSEEAIKNTFTLSGSAT